MLEHDLIKKTAPYKTNAPPCQHYLKMLESNSQVRVSGYKLNLGESKKMPNKNLPEKFTANSLIAFLAKENNLSKKDMKKIYENVFEVIAKGVLNGAKVPVGQFGKIHVKVRPATKARPGRNPLTGEEITIKAKPSTKVPKFTFSKAFKESCLKAKI